MMVVNSELTTCGPGLTSRCGADILDRTSECLLTNAGCWKMKTTRAAEKNTGPRRMTSLERRRQIVDVAGRLFSRKGFKGTTTREIAREAGISEATIFKYFARKEALFEAIIDRCCNDESGNLTLMKKLDGKQGREAFEEVVEFFMERYAEDPSFARLLMFSALEREKFSEIFFRSKGMEVLGYLSRQIEEMMEKGIFRPLDPELCARAFLGMVIHYCMVQEIFGFKRFFDRPRAVVAETFVDIFLNGMVTRERHK